MSFEVTIKEFAGPIDTLLSLIEKRKMPINDVSLAQITDDYISFIKHLGEEQSLSDTTHFVFIASTLALIKSKSILPSLELTEDEEGDIDELKKRLELLQHYQSVGKILKKHMHNQPQLFHARPAKKVVSFKPHSAIQTDTLLTSLKEALSAKPKPVPKTKEATLKIVIHIDEMMSSLEDRIRSIAKTDFHGFMQSHLAGKTETKEIKVYQVVGFLAMLELVRNGVMSVMQRDNFTTIEIEKI